jgi:diacylglycerol kinase family enzyme
MAAPLSRMHIVLLNNPSSGRGTGAAIASDLSARLTSAAHTVTRLAASKDLAPAALRDALGRADLLVVAGGDGTLHHSLPAIIDSGVAFYHYPLGTENLFTREFGMDRRFETLIGAIERGTVRICDAADCGGRPFALMVSVGFDACVVERVAAERRGGVTRGAYVRAAVQELMRPRVPRMTVVVDGRAAVVDGEGMLVVANCRQYAARLNPAVNASMDDGKLDVVFFPHRTAGGFHPSLPGLITAQGERIEVTMHEEGPWQVDGEAAGMIRGMDVRVKKGALRVLVPG